MKGQILNFIKDNFIGILCAIALSAIVLFFSSEIHQYLGTKQNKLEFQKVEPVDRSKERSIEDCFDKRIPIEIKQFCTKEFGNEIL